MKKDPREAIIWAIIALLFVAAATCGACMANAAPVPNDVVATITVKADSAKTECVGKVKVERELPNGTKEVKYYDLYRGARGGYYYIPDTNKLDKNGKPKRRYLSKKEKQENNLK